MLGGGCSHPHLRMRTHYRRHTRLLEFSAAHTCHAQNLANHDAVSPRDNATTFESE